MATTIALHDAEVGTACDQRVADRFCYSKVEGRCLKYVIVDLAEDREVWSDQESGECSWYPATPSPAERDLIRRWRQDGPPDALWPHVVLADGIALVKRVPR